MFWGDTFFHDGNIEIKNKYKKINLKFSHMKYLIEYKFTFFESHWLQAINKLQFLIFVYRIEKLNWVKESLTSVSLVHACLHNDWLEETSI